MFFNYINFLKSFMSFILLLSVLHGKEKVSIQLKGYHQFQFAGYYAAKEQGYYDEINLDVEIKEKKFNQNVIDEVINGNAQYGVEDSVILLYKIKKKPIVIVSPIFQHSSNILISLKRSEINSPYALDNKNTIFYPNDMDGFRLLAMFQHLGVSPNLIRKREKEDYLKLLKGEIDLVPAYLTSEPFYFYEKGVDINIINPMHFGVDLYGDMLFSSRNEINHYPKRVQKFKEATLKGWKYALDNKEEIISLIQTKYKSKHSFEQLKFEANAIEEIISAKTIPLGTIDEGRIKYIYNLYKDYGLETSKININDIIFKDFEYNNLKIDLTKEERDFLKKNPILNVQNLNAFPPFNFSENGQALGYSIDYLKIIAKLLGVEINFVSGNTWAQSLELLKENKLDIIPQIAINKERKEFISFTNAKHINFVPSLLVSKNSTIQTMDDLGGKKVAVLNKSFAHTILKEYFPDVIIYPVSKPNETVEALVNGIVDVGIDGLSLLEYYIQKNMYRNLRTVVIRDPLLKKIPLYMGVSKNNKVLLSILNKADSEVQHSTKIKLKNMWMQEQFIEDRKETIFNKAEQEYLLNKKQLNMCIDPNWMPYESIKDNKHIGITSDYIKLFQQQLPIPIKLIQTTNWTQSLEYAKNRYCDFVTMVMKTEKGKEKFLFSNEYLNAPLVISTLSTRRTINDISNFLDRTYGMVKGSSYKEILKNKYPNIKIEEIDNIEDGLDKVKNNQLFGVIDTLASLGYAIHKDYTNLKITGKIKGDWSFSIATRNDEVLLNDIFNKLINTISEEEEKKILNNWILVKFEDSMDYTKFVFAFIVLFLIISIVVYKNRAISKINKKMESYIDIVDENVLTSSTDLEGKIVTVSQAFCQISGYTKNELVGKSHQIIRHEDMPDEIYKDLWNSISIDKTWKGEIKNKRKDGSFYWVDSVISPRYDDSNIKIGYISIRHDITDKKRVEYLSISDELTGLYNKRHFNKNFKIEINRAKRDGTRVGFLMFDVDFFKQYNDTYGHAQGDFVLSSIGQKLNQLCKRSTDISFRIGGEEFAVIFHPSSIDAAFTFAELIRVEIEKLSIPHEYNNASKYVTVSIGLYSEIGLNIKTPEELYSLVDKGLYKAKSLGRNQTIKV